MKTRPSVSVVLVNFRGADDTITCLQALRSMSWSDDSLEVIVVDNASGDDSVARISAAAPEARLIPSKVNTGFAGGCNLGAAKATGRYLAFINNDARPDEHWLDAAVNVLERDPEVACVASRVLDWHGNVIDFDAAGLAWYGHGFKLHAGAAGELSDAEEADILFASGAAMIIDAQVFARVGGFDERYFMFFEDVDLGWRLWLLGYRVRYVPASLVYHRHHASMAEVGSFREHYLLERNALFTIFKNYDDENLRAMLPAAILLSIGRGVSRGGDDTHMLDMVNRSDPDPIRATVHKETLAGTFAVDDFYRQLADLTDTRRELQGARRRPDAEILPLFRVPFLANSSLRLFVDQYATAVEAFGVEERFSPRRRILVVTGDTLEPAMAGPAIRSWQIARALSREHDVMLVSTTRAQGLEHPDFEIRKVNGHQLKKLVDWSDIVVFQGYILFENPTIGRPDKVVVADIYDPFHLEQLEQARDLAPADRRIVVRSATDVLNEQLARGDLFLCASDKQRDFWLGQLAAVGRINPMIYDEDESLDQLIRVVPFGVSDSTPFHRRNVLRNVVPGITDDSKIILWGGGVYNWFDPISLLHAVDKLRRRLPEVRLFFLGMKHPNPHVPEMRMAVRTRELADELGLTNTHVFFNEGWVEYEDRQNYLLESDLGVSTHLDHVETEFSFRTRILDYLWAGLPVVATGGDSFAELIEARGLGATVPAGDVEALEAALYEVLSNPDRLASSRKAADELSQEYRWSTVLEPLVEFCRNPRRAPDLVSPEMAALVGVTRSQVTRPLRMVHLREDLRTIGDHVRKGEVGLMVRKATGRGDPCGEAQLVEAAMTVPSPWRALVYVGGDERRFLPIASDLAAIAIGRVVVAARDAQQLQAFADLPVERSVFTSASEAVNAVWREHRAHVFTVTEVVALPSGVPDRAIALLESDLRSATVSFFSNDAGLLSFPNDHASPAPPPGFNEASLTERLRSLGPPIAPCPVPYAAGGAVLISAVALGAVGLLDEPPGREFETSLADFSMRARERGFVGLLDPETYVFRSPTPGVAVRSAPVVDADWLQRRHPQLVDAFAANAEPEQPVELVRRLARAKAFGLRVLIDDASLGPYETGAQITTLAIIDALAKHPEVAEVGVALSSHMPEYAKAVLSQPKVNVELRVGQHYGAFTDFDVLHRTAQADRDFDVAASRGVARRVVMSVLDLIAYRAGSYHATSHDWLEYRRSLRDAAHDVDGVTTISHDVADVVRQERLPVEADRLFPILYGTEHLSGQEDAWVPEELAAHAGSEFVFCLGTDYAHKNRDIAIAIQRELRSRSARDLLLVLAGPSVPYGGSRNAERQLLRHGDDSVVLLPNVTSRERNWLFRHAAVVLYPTSAEGFGLVPFEAARFGSPTVTVGFGPLLETSPDVPVVASSWDPGEIADCVERLMESPVLRREQVSVTLAAADRYSWARTADEFVRMYRALLARPPR